MSAPLVTDEEKAVIQSLITNLQSKVGLQAPAHSPSSTAHSYFNINAGGAALWISVSVCAAMAVFLIGSRIDLSDQNNQMRATIADQSDRIREQDRKIDRMQDHLSVIYRLAPSLKPPEPQK